MLNLQIQIFRKKLKRCQNFLSLWFLKIDQFYHFNLFDSFKSISASERRSELAGLRDRGFLVVLLVEIPERRVCPAGTHSY